MEEASDQNDQFHLEDIDLEEERAQKPPKPHPLETQNPLLRFIFWWVGDVVKTSAKTTWTQDMNYDLPEIDESTTTKEKISNSLSNHKSIIVAILSTYKLAIVWIALAKILTNVASNIAGILRASALTLLLKSPIYHDPQNASKCAFQLFLSTFISMISPLIGFYVTFYADRLSMRIRSGLYSAIHNKIMRFSILNSTSIRQGLITDLIEIDVQVLSKLYHQADKLFSGVLGIPINLGFFAYYFGVWQTALFLGVNLSIPLVKIGVSKISAMIRKRYLEAKDKRMSLLRNVLDTTDYIKINGLEDYFCLEMFEKRETELKWRRAGIILGLFETPIVNIFLGLLPIIIFRFYWQKMDFGSRGFSFFLQFQSYTGRVGGGINAFVEVFGYYLKMMVSLTRLNKFFKSEDKRTEYLVEIEHEDGQEALIGEGYALKVLNGSFKWRFTEEQELKPLEEDQSVMEMEGAGEDNQASRRRTEQDMNAFEARRAEEQSLGLLTETVETQLNNQERSSEVVPKGSFRLKRIDLEIKKGEKVAVIGGSCSGMSSLLYALIGEMVPMNDSKVYKSGSFSYLPQSRWLMASSVKENITMGKPLDEELLKTSLEGADMAQDIDLLTDGIETLISDDGDNVSGGQKARIALARCFYQW